MRFSSFGDVTQSLSIPAKLKQFFPGAELHFLTRSDFAELCSSCSDIDQVLHIPRSANWRDLWQVFRQLKKQNYSHIYDAHNSFRSKIISLLLRPPLALDRIFNPPLFTRKKQKRWKRFLLFKFRINLFEMPFSGQRDLLEPLERWGMNAKLPPAPVIKIKPETQAQAQAVLVEKNIPKNFICLAPSSAHQLKRWPIEYWKELVVDLKKYTFVCLGGPEDHFIQEIQQVSPLNVYNMAGQLSLEQSAALIQMSQLLISNDTGALHIAEQLGKKTIAIMGPAPFGFPSRESTTILETQLACRPCSKHGQGPCINATYQKCMRDITPKQVITLCEKVIEA